MAEQLTHKALTEFHDLGIRLPFGIEIRTTLAAAHGQGGQAVFEYLLKGEKLQDAQIDTGVEAQATFVRPDSAVHLDPVSCVYLNLLLVIKPGHPEDDNPLGDNHSF